MNDLRLNEALRDRFFELSAAKKRATSAEARAFRDEVNQVDVEAITRINGLRVSFHPTVRFKAVRFFDADCLDAKVRPLFARPAPHLPHLAAGFVDPEELSFRTFENIVSLDGFFDDATALKLEDRIRFGKKQVYAFTLGTSAATRERLLRLDALTLYAPPLNAGSRGGERFIFHCTKLAEALTAAVRDGLGASLLGGFSHVNPVFRCNRFEPGDEKFHHHFDTPYFDANRKHVSRYTLLVYLTGGVGSPTLSVEGEEVLARVAPFTCVVLDQKYAHEGRSFDAGRKVFLRTELIFEEPTLEHDPAIAEVFSKAVYLTGESVFRPELERYAEEAYNRVADAHWRGLQPSTRTEPLIHKNFRGAHFVTNGFDFWFPREAMTPQQCAALALLDFFNCEVGGVAFRKACKTSTLPAGSSPTKALAPHSTRAEDPPLAVLDKDALFPTPEHPNSACCPFHHGDSFDPTRHEEIVDLYASAQAFARERIAPAPVLLMGKEVFLDPERFVVDAGKIHVLSDQAVAPVNFAACWNFGGSPPNYLGVEAMVNALQPLVPPILLGEADGCWHLRFDFFRNSWMVKNRRLEVPVPSIRRIDPGEAEELDEENAQPWLDAIDESLLKDAQSPAANVWWGDDSPLLRELTAGGLRRFH